jgi:gluconate 2-dehydrogenase gamma chain
MSKMIMKKIKRIAKPTKKIPEAFQNIEQWQSNRRTVLKGALLAGALSQISIFTSCSTPLANGNDLLSAQQATIFHTILNTYFPADGNGPSASDINAFEYIMWVLHDNLNRTTEDNQYIIDGIDWVNDTAQELYLTDFTELSEKQQNVLIEQIIKMTWGKSWSSVVITLILEALVLDPLYGGNTDSIGWEWLNHTPGFPRPTEANRYERIMEKQMKIKV